MTGLWHEHRAARRRALTMGAAAHAGEGRARGRVRCLHARLGLWRKHPWTGPGRVMGTWGQTSEELWAGGVPLTLE